PALAMQFGINMGGTTGEGEATIVGTNITPEFDVETSEIGFALNACEDCRWFNYRLGVSYTSANLEYGEFFGTTWEDDADGLNITNTFGLKLVNQNGFNFWVGPTIHIAGMVVDGDVSDDETASIWGIGPTMGLDFTTPEGVTLAVELSAR